jgi:hypothetical protein
MFRYKQLQLFIKMNEKISSSHDCDGLDFDAFARKEV